MRTLFTSRARDPWADLARMQRELSRLMSPLETGHRPGVYPPANFYRSNDGFILRLEMPGVDSSSLDITNQKNELSIAGERRPPEVSAEASYHRRERRFGRFRRTFTLPDTVDGGGAEATYHNGVLEIRLPKKPEAQPRQITVATA